MARTPWPLALLLLLPHGALAQQPLPQPAPAPPQQGSAAWSQLPRMQLERQFAGPLQDVKGAKVKHSAAGSKSPT